MSHGEDRQCHGGIGVEVGGRWKKARDQSDQVRNQDKEGDRGDQRKVGFALGPHGLFDHVLNAVDHRFKEILQAGRNRLDVAFDQNCNQD